MNLKTRKLSFLYEEDDYPALCVIEDTDHLKNEDVKDELTNVLFEESQMTSNHISGDELIEKIISSKFMFDQNVQSDDDQEDFLEDVIIEYSLE